MKRVIAFLMVMVMVISNVLVCLADDTGINGGGTGSNDAPSTEAYIGRYHAFQENNGIRIVITNTKGVVVSNFVDLVNYRPEQIDSFNAELARIYKKYYTQTGRYNTPKDFRYWMGIKNDSVYYSSPTELRYAFNSSKEAQESASERGEAKSQKMYTYSELETFFETGYNIDFPGQQSPLSPSGGTYQSQHFRTGEPITIPRDIQGPVQRVAGGSGQEGTGDTWVNQLYTRCPDGRLVVSYLLGLNMPVLDFHGNYLGVMEPLFQFIYEDDIKLHEELKAVDGKNHVADVVKNQGYKVMFEPIHWAVNEVVNGNAPNGANGIDLKAFWNTPYIEYGTVSQISYLTYEWLWEATKVWLQQRGEYTSDDGVTNYLKASGQSWDWSLAYMAYKLEKTDKDMGMATFEDYGLNPNSLPAEINLQFWHDNANKLGYGLIITDIRSMSGTPTWDKKAYPKESYQPGPSPKNTNDNDTFPSEYPSEGDEYSKLNKDHKFNIVKFYATKQRDGSYKYTENHTREKAIHTITIEDEPLYQVDSWFTSPTFQAPQNPNDSYDDWKGTLPKGSLSGDKAGMIQVPASSNDTALYMRLVETPSLTVIKYFPLSWIL